MCVQERRRGLQLRLLIEPSQQVGWTRIGLKQLVGLSSAPEGRPMVAQGEASASRATLGTEAKRV